MQPGMEFTLAIVHCWYASDNDFKTQIPFETDRRLVCPILAQGFAARVLTTTSAPIGVEDLTQALFDPTDSKIAPQARRPSYIKMKGGCISLRDVAVYTNGYKLSVRMRNALAMRRPRGYHTYRVATHRFDLGGSMISLADLHMHTTASDGTLSPQALVNAVLLHQLQTREEPLLRVIAITDHDSLAGAWTAMAFQKSLHSEADLEIIPGAEISSADGHILALNIKKVVPKGLSAAATIEAIHEQGGLAIAAHPYAYFPFLKELKGIKRLIADPVVGGALDAIEVCNANPTETLNNYFTRWVNRRHLRRPEVGGSDCHFLSAVARTGTSFPGKSAADLLQAMRDGTTRAVGAVYGPFSLYQYMRDRLAWKRFCEQDPIVRAFHDW